MSYLWISNTMKCPSYEFLILWNILYEMLYEIPSMKCPIFEFLILWNVLSMKYPVYEMSSMKCHIYEFLILWNILFMKCLVYEMPSIKYPIYEFLFLWNVLSMKDPTPFYSTCNPPFLKHSYYIYGFPPFKYCRGKNKNRRMWIFLFKFQSNHIAWTRIKDKKLLGQARQSGELSNCHNLFNKMGIHLTPSPLPLSFF